MNLARLLSLIVLLTAAEPVAAADAPAAGDAAAGKIDFQRQVKSILSERCFACHGPDAERREADLRLDSSEGATADLGGYAAVVPGDPDASELILRITAEDAADAMPPADVGQRLSDDEVQILRAWIAQGAEYTQHWSYVPPVRSPPPAVADHQWPAGPIDRHVLAALEAEGLSPSPTADRYTLVRRLSLDLTGLPPTPQQADAFVADKRPDAYRRLVDSLLADPAFAERWAAVWLDLARYADSAGYADDPPRTIWAYRDYVIRAFAENLPLDRFTIEQIAGDLLDDPSDEALIATAFHRNTMTNSEGGTDDEEFRSAAVVDRVNTTMAVWMGTTMACAQCHTHKYDPITQEEYFRFYAFFNNTADADLRDESPTVAVYDAQQKVRRADLQQELQQLQQAAQAGQVAPAADQIESLQQAIDGIKPATSVPVMRELAEKRRETFVQIRGNYRDTAARVEPGVPKIFHPLPDGAAADRLALAQWLVDSQNPLTARVFANRVWEQLFGTGLVATSEEFGSQGELPSHPQLLDALALQLIDSGWDFKQLVRRIVCSASYQQSATVTPELLRRDPGNRLLTRGPRFRIGAEVVRDQALAISGLLSRKMFGPPVHPPRPVLNLKAAFGGSTDWQDSQGADRYRRGLYTEWRRSMPYPSMATFDMPSREVCTLNRGRTNTPLQALITLNDPVYVETAQGLARRTLRERPKAGDAKRIAWAMRLCLIRPPEKDEVAAIQRLLDQARQWYAERRDEAAKMATEPIGPIPIDLAGVTNAEMAAWTVVGNVLLNLDEVLQK